MTAAEKILQKALVGSNIDSREWNSVQAGLRDRAFFSSQVAELQFLDAFRTGSAAHAAGAADISKIRMALRDYLTKKDYQPTDDIRGTIKDLTSKARLDVIIKTNVATARGFVRYANGMSPGAFAAFPAMKLLRIRQRKQGRAWDARWKAAGDSVGWKGATPDFGTRTALKDSPIWHALGEGAGGYRDGLGNPYPPFAWGSGVGVVDVSRKEAIELGLISDEELRAKTAEMEKQRDAGTLPGMNDGLSVPYNGNTDAYNVLKEKFQDQITHADGKIVWRAGLVRDAFKSGDEFRINLGKPTQALKESLPTDELRAMLKDKAFALKGDWLDKPRKSGGTHREHFEPLEKDPRNIPLTSGDLDLIPTLWRNPDRVIPGDFTGSFVCQLDTFDGGILNMVVDVKRTPVIHTLYKNKPGMGLGASIEQSSALQRMRHVQHAEPGT